MGAARPLTAEDLTEEVRVAFLSHVDGGDADSCWVWTGLIYVATGYGRLKVGRDAEYLAHRVSYVAAHGEIPAGRHVCHHCDNPPCVNPAHLVLGTHADNMADRDAKGRLHNARKTHCLRGHPFDGENLFIRTDGGRGCRQCHQDRGRATTAKRKAARVKLAAPATPRTEDEAELVVLAGRLGSGCS